jgi:uncharacterized membrane protein
MKPIRAMRWLAILIVTAGYAGLFTWLMVDTWNNSGSFDPRSVQTYLLPPLSGTLGLLLALSLGVDPHQQLTLTGLREQLRAILSTHRLLVAGAFIYLASGVAGAVVWGFRQNSMPTLATAIVLTVAGYLAASVAASGRAGS